MEEPEREREREREREGKQPGKDNFNYELYKYAEDPFHERTLFFLNNIYKMREIPEDGKTVLSHLNAANKNGKLQRN
jgi:hypothetical protein